MKKVPSIAQARDKLTNLPTSQKVLVFAGTLILIGAAFYFLQLQDQIDTIQRLDVSIADQTKKLEGLKKAALRVKALENELAKSEEELAVLMTLLPDQKEIPGLLENISRLGSKVGLENILFQPQPESPQELYATIPIRLDLLGSFNDVGVFLDSISKLNRILRVENITLARQKDKKASLLQVNCTLATYRFLEDKPAGAAPAKK